MYYLWNIEVNIETHTLDGACLGLIFSIFTAARIIVHILALLLSHTL